MSLAVVDAASWIGRITEAHDHASVDRFRRLQALMNDAPDETAIHVPPLGHWLCFLPDARQDDLGPDGHPRLGRDLPDLGLPRRMWAGSRISFGAPVPIGSLLVRRTVIRSIEDKVGKSGRLAFVTLRHEIMVDGTIAITEEQDLVYREAAPPSRSSPPRQVTPQPLSERAIVGSHRFDAIELFRFSALTYNAHRIHYDRDYAQSREGYPGLVVQAPYQAMHLMAHLRRRNPGRMIRSFAFRVHGPLFEGEEAVFGIEASANGATLWLRPDCGPPSITAIAEFAP